MPHESERHAGREVAFAASSQKDSRRVPATQFHRVAFIFLNSSGGIESPSGTDAGRTGSFATHALRRVSRFRVHAKPWEIPAGSS
jgi:hypothetical protein